jgi:hypothetical protein
MNPILEKLLYLFVGGAAGSLITIFVTKPKHEEQIDRLEDALEKYETQMDKEIEKARKAVLEGFEDETKTDKSSDEYDEEYDENDERLEEISNRIVRKVKQAKTKPAMEKLIKDNGYAEEPEEEDELTRNETYEEDPLPFDNYDDIEVITGEEYGEYSDYDKEELYFTRDKVLVDDQGNIIEDVDNIVGFESLNQFGTYDDNVVHVRNHRLKSDIAIYKDPDIYRNFTAK